MPDTDLQPIHRLFLHLQELPYSLRTLYTAALLLLAIAYLFAMIYIWSTYANRDGKPMLTLDDLVIAYSGNKQTSRVEAALRGPMAGMLPPDEKSTILGWLHRGKDTAEFESKVQPIIAKRCLACHDGSNPHLPNLKGLDNFSEVAEVDTGADIYTLVRVSHIHLFGVTFIFFIVSLIFSHAYVRPVWLKCSLIAIPFLAILADVLSWYMTKLAPGFAWAVLLGGAAMALCFASMWLVSLYQMWFYKMPDHLRTRIGGTSAKVIG